MYKEDYSSKQLYKEKNKMIKKMLIGVVAGFSMLASTAFAEITVVNPQKPGGGTTVWTEIIMKELEKHLGERIVIRNIPGARDIPGINKFHNELRFNENTIVVTHGGNGVSFLQEQVDYNYAEYDSIGLMNLNIIMGKVKGADMDKPSSQEHQVLFRSICNRNDDL